MAEMEERELLLRSLKGYLTGLAESGVDELRFGTGPAVAPPSASAGAAAAEPPAEAVQMATGCTPPAGASVGDGAGGAPLAAAALEPVLRQEGAPGARVLFVMAGDGFAGEAGGLLARIIAAMKFKQEEICLVSFRPGQDRAAMGRVVAAKLAEIAPQAVVTLGEEAAFLLLNDPTPLTRLRGSFLELQGIPVMPTLHPEMLLDDEGLKRHVWEDMKLVMRLLGKD